MLKACGTPMTDCGSGRPPAGLPVVSSIHCTMRFLALEFAVVLTPGTLYLPVLSEWIRRNGASPSPYVHVVLAGLSLPLEKSG